MLQQSRVNGMLLPGTVTSVSHSTDQLGGDSHLTELSFNWEELLVLCDTVVRLRSGAFMLEYVSFLGGP